MVHQKLNELRPYVTGIRFVKDLPVVDLILREGWSIFESETITYKPSATNPNYFMVFPKNPTGSIDSILEQVDEIIKVNIEREKKLILLKAKIEELKVLFTNKSLTELERLKFSIENINEPTLEDLNSQPPKVISNRKIKNGLELPPTKKEKEEV
jgi:hypothetical protein